MSLAIARLHTHFRSPQPLPDERRDDWLAALAAADGDALCRGLAADDEWIFIARLPLALRWTLDAGAGDVGEQWQRQLRRAIEAALAQSEPSGVVRYASRREALADLFYRAALGDLARRWIWRRLQLVVAADDDAPAVLAAGVAVLAREAENVWPVLCRLLAGEVATASFSALLRALPAASWQRLLAASPRTAPYLALAAAAPAAEETVAAIAAARAALRESAPAAELLLWVQRRSAFAAPHLATLSVLLAALRWPASATPPAVQARRLAAARAELRALSGASPASNAIGAEPGAAPATADRSPARADELPPLPPLAADWQRSEWGGLLFWLARVPATGALAWIEAHAAGDAPGDSADSAESALTQWLAALADALATPAGDPARDAFCGGEAPAGEIPAAFADTAVGVAAGWEAWLAEAAPELPPPRLHTVCRRRGRIRCEPGWIELVLALDSVDTATRRLGLDLDPGWLPWLACVLRIRYE